MQKGKPPTRGELAARPTLSSEDQFANRNVRQRSSDVQEMPQGDNRYRVNYSATFYVVQLIGTWVNIVESAERSVRSRNNTRWVTFETREYELRRLEQFKPLVARFLQLGCYAYIGGRYVESEKELRAIVPQRFIYIASTAALKKFNDMRQSKSKS